MALEIPSIVKSGKHRQIHMQILKQHEYEIRSCSSVIKNLFLFFLTLYEYLRKRQRTRRVVDFAMHITKTIISLRFHGHFSISTFAETEIQVYEHCVIWVMRTYFLYTLQTCRDSFSHVEISILIKYANNPYS